MRKVKLDLESLAVESFPTVDLDAAGRGTVHGQDQLSGYVTCGCACSETDGVRVCKSCGPSCYA